MSNMWLSDLIRLSANTDIIIQNFIGEEIDRFLWDRDKEHLGDYDKYLVDSFWVEDGAIVARVIIGRS